MVKSILLQTASKWLGCIQCFTFENSRWAENRSHQDV